MEEAVEKAAEQTEQCEVRMQKLREQRPADVERMHAFLQDARSDKLEMESKARTRFVSLRNSLDSALMELLAHKSRCEKNVQAALDASLEAHGSMMGEEQKY